LPKIEDGKSWLRRPKLYKRIVEPHKKKKKKEGEADFIVATTYMSK